MLPRSSTGKSIATGWRRGAWKNMVMVAMIDIIFKRMCYSGRKFVSEDDFTELQKTHKVKKKLLTRSQASEEEQKYDLEDFPACCHTGTWPWQLEKDPHTIIIVMTRIWPWTWAQLLGNDENPYHHDHHHRFHDQIRQITIDKLFPS